MSVNASALERMAHLSSGAQAQSASRHTIVIVLAGILLVESLVLGLWTANRGVNADEGFYLAASRHVAEGHRLYGDVFFPQMPYLPWLQGAIFGAHAGSLTVGRALSVAVGTLAAVLVGAIAWRQSQNVAVAAVVACLYIFNAVLLNGLSIAKNFAWPNVCLLIAFAPFAFDVAHRTGWALLAGVAMAGAIGFRLAVAPVALVLALLAWRISSASLITFAIGGIIGSLPWLVAAVRAPEEFWFCNVTFHSMRREITGLGPILAQKMSVIAKWFLLPQHLVLWGLAGAGMWLAPRRVWSAAACAAVLMLSCAAATPTYLEYMSQFVPFVLLMAVPAIAVLVRHRAAAAIVLAIYLAGLYPALKSAEGDDTVADKRALWQLDRVREVAAYLEAHTPSEGPVLSWWEGYPVLSNRPGYVGVGFWESNVARKLDAERAHRFHLLQQDDVRALVERRAPSAVVVPDGTWDALRPVIDAGYVPAYRVGTVQIYLPAGAS